MPGHLRDYQVLDVLCGGTFYKVRHKATNDIYAWRAVDCSAYSHKQILFLKSWTKGVGLQWPGAMIRTNELIYYISL